MFSPNTARINFRIFFPPEDGKFRERWETERNPGENASAVHKPCTLFQEYIPKLRSSNNMEPKDDLDVLLNAENLKHKSLRSLSNLQSERWDIIPNPSEH